MKILYRIKNFFLTLNFIKPLLVLMFIASYSTVTHAGKPPLIETQVVHIQANAESLYETLLDFAGYERWNPWIYEAMGDAVVGGHVWAKLVLNDKEMESDHIVTELVDGEKFCWRDEMWYSFMAGGERCRYLEHQNDGSTLIRGTFQFNGVFAGLGHLLYADQMLDGMNAELLGLKQWAEK